MSAELPHKKGALPFIAEFLPRSHGDAELFYRLTLVREHSFSKISVTLWFTSGWFDDPGLDSPSILSIISANNQKAVTRTSTRWTTAQRAGER